MLEVHELSFHYKHAKKNVLNGIDLSFGEKEFVGILGPNGTGKTTLLKCLNRIYVPQSGEVLLNGVNLKDMSRKAIAQQISYVPQYVTNDFGMRVVDVVMMGRTPFSTYRFQQKDKELTFEMLEKLDLTDFAFRNVNELSGGERQRVYVARALVGKPAVVLLDEPTASLDVKNQLALLTRLEELAKDEGFTVILTIHDLNLASMFCSRVIMLKNGLVAVDGAPVDELEQRIVKEIYGIDTAVTIEDGYKHIRLLRNQ